LMSFEEEIPRDSRVVITSTNDSPWTLHPSKSRCVKD
jgi:hypothetical protein